MVSLNAFSWPHEANLLCARLASFGMDAEKTTRPQCGSTHVNGWRESWFPAACFVLILGLPLLAGCDPGRREVEPEPAFSASAVESVSRREVPKGPSSSPIVAAARSQVGKTKIYDPAYVGLDYPGGDVPMERGVCTDVIIRALRDAHSLDLQKRVHEDMKQAFSSYPKIWGLKKTDRNIDHRRVPNLRTYFQRKGYALEASRRAADYLPGDLVTCKVGGNRPHIMIVSDRKTAAGVPLVIHNIGRGAVEEDRLFDFPITGHYRIKARAEAE